MKFSDEVIAVLRRPFDPARVQFRIGRYPKGDPQSGTRVRVFALAYISARDVMDRLDEAFGSGGWSCEHEIVFSPQGKCANVCRIAIPGGLEPTVVSDCAEETQIEGIKGAASDAFKRAAVKLGVFRYAYDLGESWCEAIYSNGSWSIPLSEVEKLRATLPSPDPQSRQQFIKQNEDPFFLDKKKDELLFTLKSKYTDEFVSKALAYLRDKYGQWANLDVELRDKVLLDLDGIITFGKIPK